MPNRLATERSPYLLQHAHNPVDWYPWTLEAFARARELDRPVFLSIGYAACHWCHVMERESFESPRIAALLNAHFVSIKVDREERPDLDQIYMQAVMAMRGQGGWPLSAFLTPEQEVFFGGTYWPPTDRYGLPGFETVLRRVADAYRERRAEIAAQAAQITEFLAAGSFPSDESHPPLDRPALLRIARELEARVDWQQGGFDGAPKFPHAMDLEFLLRMATAPEAAEAHPPLRSEQAVRLSLERMAAGGIYDQIGGGFARYSVDAHWLVPHFEKMLYDNGLLARLYLDAYRAWGAPRHAEIAGETLQYLLREMRDPGGAFHSSEDADSEGVEGKFYVWSADELATALGPDYPRFRDVYGVTPGGNFAGSNILHLPQPLAAWAAAWDLPVAELAERLAANRLRLRELRAQRVRPAKDDKVLTAWNGLVIEALATAAQCWPESAPERLCFLTAAQEATRFFLDAMRTSDGGLYHAYRGGVPYQTAFVDDYAGLINALLSVHAADGDLHWLAAAETLAHRMVAEFADEKQGGFFYTGIHQDRLIARPKECQDNSVPSGNSAAATALARLGQMLQEPTWLQAAESAVRAAQPLLARAPAAATQLLNAADRLTRPQHLVVIAATAEDLPAVWGEIRRIQRSWSPTWHFVVVPPAAQIPSGLQRLLQDKTLQQQQSALYHCHQFSCAPPRVGRAAIESFFRELDRNR